MTFAARDVLVSLAFFATVYCPLSLLVALLWWALQRMSPTQPIRSASLLFGLRISSFVVSAAVTVFFTFPSFWLMERASLDEDAATFVLAACALLILGVGLFRALSAQARTSRAITQWRLETSRAAAATGDATTLTPALDASKGAPALVLVGLRRPKVLISDLAVSVLSNDELQIAIRHEHGHLRSLDNLKKVLISATPFPGMTGLENSWREAAELAADDSAVASRHDALDLAAALIKLSRSKSSSRQLPEPVLASQLVSGSCSVGVRVERLLAWDRAARSLQRAWVLPGTLVILVAMFVAIASHYGATLVLTHHLTELLVP